MPKLTKSMVDASSPDPNGGRLYLWDTEVKGFGLQVLPSGVKSYVLQYRTASGQTRRATIGKHGSPWTCDEARKKARKMLEDLAGGADPLEAKKAAREAMTVKELAELYLAEGPADKPNKKASSWKQDGSNLLRHVIPLIGARVANTLTAADIARLQRDIAAGKTAADEKIGFRARSTVTGGKGTAARTLAVTGAMLEWAAAPSRKYIAGNPAKGVKPYKGEKMERFLSEREVARLAEGMAILQDLGMLSDEVAAAIRLWMTTGCRKTEITNLKWSYVDFDRGCLRLPDSKTGQKVVTLSAPALKVLADLPRRPDCEWVLPSSRGDGPVVGVWKDWDLLRDWCDLEDVRIHDLRHSFASFAAADGASLFLIGKVLGHSQASTTERYAHLSDDPVRAVADRAAGRIARAMGLEKTEGEGAEVVPLRRVRTRDT